MCKVGIWIEDSNGNRFAVCKDSRGRPDLVWLPSGSSLKRTRQAKEKARQLYPELTGKQYPYGSEVHTYIHLQDLLEEGRKRI